MCRETLNESMHTDSVSVRAMQVFALIRKTGNNYPICNTPASFLRFRWLDVFKTFPHPLFCHQPQTPEPFPSAE